MVQDRRGELWLALYVAGVDRFDGQTFTRFGSGDGSSEKIIQTQAVYEDEVGILWFGTRTGLVSYDGASIRVFTTSDGLSDNDIKAIVEDRQGRLWIGTANGVCSFTENRCTPLDAPQIHDVGFSAMMVDHADNLWIGTVSDGLFMYNGQSITRWSPESALDHNTIQALAIDESNNIWIGTPQGLLRFSGAELDVFTIDDGLSSDNVNALMLDRSGTLWVGTENGASRYEGSSFVPFDRQSMANIPVRSILEDDEGNIWFATNGKGLLKYTPSPFTLFNTEDGLSGNMVWDIDEGPDGLLWVALQNGIDRYDGESFTTIEDSSGVLLQEEVLTMYHSQTGAMWLGSRSSLVRYDDNSYESLRSVDRETIPAIIYLTEDDDGTLWGGTNSGGLIRYDSTGLTRFTTADGLSDNSISAILPYDDGVLWLGTSRGIDIYDGQTFSRFETGQALDEQWISDIQKDDDGDIWISTQDGVYLYQPWKERDSDGAHNLSTTPFEHFSTIDGLNDEMTYFLLFDGENNVWVGTNKGVNRIDVGAFKRTGEKIIQSYGKSEGFLGIETNHHAAYMARDGSLWFGTVGGLARYDPTLDRINTVEPKTHINGLRLFFDQPDWTAYSDSLSRWTNLPQDLVLPYEQNHLSFDFMGISYTAPTNVRYQYKLKGFDKSFSPVTDERVATYSNLPPGTYNFLVKAGNSDDVWNREPAAFAFEIEFPFWQTWWFYVLSGSGILGGFLAFIRWYERAAERRRRVLEQTVAQRTEALEMTNQALVVAEAKAQDAANAKSEFLANMSHEIRTPMNSVIGFTNLLLESNLDDTNREYVNIIQTSGEALLKIINHVLDLSKFESGKIDLERQPFSVRNCVDESLDLMAMSADEKGLELTHIIQSDVPDAVFGDSNRLRQVLVNLLSNAIKFTETGEVSVQLALDPVSEPESESESISRKIHTLHFTVVDTGIGIPKDRIEDMFESFTQADASTTRKFGGTGLGLTISKGLCELMGGRMWVESDLGVGSSFHFTIQAEEAPALESLPSSTGIQVPLRGIRVLVVDDLATNLQMLEMQLRHWGMETVSALSGAEAITLLDEGERVDVAIVDMLMPGMNGVEVAQEIRSRPDWIDLPLILLTSLGSEIDEKAAGNYWAAKLSKPVRQSNLYDALSGVLGDSILERGPELEPESDKNEDDGDNLAAEYPLRILLAEDHDVNQKLFSIILSGLGYEADVVSDGAEVLEALRKHPYDVVLMDMHMPIMDGPEATKRIAQEWPEEKRPYVVALTAAVMKNDRAVCMEAGMQDFLTKPMNKEDLIRVLKSSPRLGSQSSSTIESDTIESESAGKSEPSNDRVSSRPEDRPARAPQRPREGTTPSGGELRQT